MEAGLGAGASLRGAAVWLICGALVLPRKGHVQAEGNATLLRALEGAVSFRGLGVKRRKSDEAVSWDRKRGEAKFQAAILPTQPPAVGDPASPLSPHGAPSDAGWRYARHRWSQDSVLRNAEGVQSLKGSVGQR